MIKIKKLTLHKTTLRVLSTDDLKHIAGGTPEDARLRDDVIGAALEPRTARCPRR